MKLLRAELFNTEKEIKVKLEYLQNKNKLDDGTIERLYNDITKRLNYNILAVHPDKNKGTIICDDTMNTIDEFEYPNISKVVRMRNEMSERDRNCEYINDIESFLDEVNDWSIDNKEKAMKEVLELSLFEFFDYCRDVDGIPELYIYEYIKKYSDNFCSVKLQLIYRDFYPYFMNKKDSFYHNQDRIARAIKRYKDNGFEIPYINPDIYKPPTKDEYKGNPEKYDKYFNVAQKYYLEHKSIKELDTRALLAVESCELMGLFAIEHLLRQKIDESNSIENKLELNLQSDKKIKFKEEPIDQITEQGKSHLTVAQRAYAIEMLLNRLGVKIGVGVDKTQMVRFIHYVIGGARVDDVKNTGTYKKVGDASLKDTEIVDKIFLDLGIK